MWPNLVPNVPLVVLLQLVANLAASMIAYGQQCSRTSKHARHVGSSLTPNQPSVSYSPTVIKSLRKSRPKTTLPPEFWKKLGDFGIRKPFRSKRKKTRLLRDSRTPLQDGHPVDSTATSPVSVPATEKNKVPRNILPRMLICNTRCLYNKIDELECVIRINNVDVISVTETWLHKVIPDSAISIKDFTLFRKDRGSPCGGVAAYVSCSIPCKQLTFADMPDTITDYVAPTETCTAPQRNFIYNFWSCLSPSRRNN